jgi:hypothetical protein
MASQPSYVGQQQQGPRRNTSGRTASTSSSSAQVRRSSSSRSTGSPLSYVALLRKQKATVWCDRSQAEDPRFLAAQRLAKERAEREVALIPGQSGLGIKNRTPPQSTAGSFTTGVARKIRHHGAQKAAPYAGGNMAGAGVPMRLSATEVDDDDEDESPPDSKYEDDGWNAADAAFYSGRSASAVAAASAAHRRTSSGRSSLGRGGHSRSPSEMNAVAEETPLASEFGQRRNDYFSGKAEGRESDASTPEDEREREKREDDLVRRGSVDERAMTMSGVRLFVANPDLDD